MYILLGILVLSLIILIVLITIDMIMLRKDTHNKIWRQQDKR